MTSPSAGVDSQSSQAGSTRNPEKPRLSEVDVEVLANIEKSVQNPAEGPFGFRDLTWTPEFRARRGKHGRDCVVQQCYIPPTRIQDFIAGVQSGKEGTQCVFRETKENHKRAEDAKEGPRTPLDFARSVLVTNHSFLF